MGKVGLQLYTVREAASRDLLGTVKQVAEMGYEAVQFAGFFNTPAKELKKVLDENGIVVAGSHTPLEQLSDDNIDEVLRYNQEIGNDLIVLPYLPAEVRRNEDDYKRLAERLNWIGERCKENGFQFAYHNHDFEFVPVEGQTGFDLIFGNTDPDLVRMELDCYWVQFAGFDPVDMIHQYKDRIVSLHIKDLKQENGEKRSTEVGMGELDVAGIIEAGRQYGIHWYIVEQEHFDRDPMESVAISVRYLKKITETHG